MLAKLLAELIRNQRLGQEMKKNPGSIDEIRQVLAHCLPELKKEYHVDSLELFGRMTQTEQGF